MKIDICLSSDNNYAKYMAATIVSILKNSTNDEKLIFHILNAGINEKNKIRILSLKNIKECEIIFYDIDTKIYEKWFDKIEYKCHFSPAIFIRLSIPSILNDIDKVLYLDCDIIVTKSLSELFTIDIENYYALVVRENIKENKSYKFNSGVLLINNKLCKETNIEKEFIKRCNEFNENDQDVLNYVLKDKVKYIDKKWNFYSLKTYYPINTKLEDVAILHYIESQKPWNEHTGNLLFVDEFWKYYQYTPWFRDEPITSFQTILKQKFGDYEEIKLKVNWINIFGIYSNYNTLKIVLFGIPIKINIKNFDIINKIAWYIPIRKWREAFKDKFR
ncbi:glycosyltransferase family 8 protein [Brachyspira pulli]|uniref:glycosyltransferase family 8 protein n=1 Tax=Brachyspira pulli TaxID=310721 RepID=UPI003005D24D